MWCPLGGFITWHRAVECLLSFSQKWCHLNSSIAVFSYKYDAIVVSYCDKQHFYV